jgi:hypothetical protein
MVSETKVAGVYAFTGRQVVGRVVEIAVWIEPVWVWEQIRIVMQCPAACQCFTSLPTAVSLHGVKNLLVDLPLIYDHCRTRRDKVVLIHDVSLGRVR